MVAIFKNAAVNMANTKACIKPTNNSSPKNGNGAIKGIKNATTVSSTSPAKIFPNNLNENAIILDISEINSNTPT
jgi:hypothetical protein